MIASWRGVAVAAALAVALAVIVIVDGARGSAPVDRALVPGLDPARVTELIWDRGGHPAIRAVRVGERWELRTPDAVPADPGAIGEVLAALRGGRWHRLGDPPAAHATLTVVTGAERHAIAIAEPIAGTEQSWLVADGRGAVADRWIARALDRDPLSLRIRQPLAAAGSARSITVTAGRDAPGGAPVELQLEGWPRHLVRPSALVLAPDVAGELERALREVRVVRLPDGPAGARGLAVRLAGAGPVSVDVGVELGGRCPGAPELVAISGTAGDGCVEAAASVAVERAVARLRQPPEAIVDPRPVAFEPRHLVLADAATLDTSPPRVGDAAADWARVAELLDALAAPAAPAALPQAPPTARITVRGATPGGAEVVLDLFASHVLARHGEPIALRPTPGAWSRLVRPSRALRDLGLWLEEPTAITALVIDDVRYQRGAVVGEWTRQPPRAPGATVPAAQLEALAGQLAAPRVLGFVDGSIAVAHRVTITVTPPAGAATQRALALGAPRADGCPAVVGRDQVLLPTVICAQVAALAR